MLRLDNIQTIGGINVYQDDKDQGTHYVVPNSPRFRLDENGLPVFKFLKYRYPIDRGEGKKGGGYCFFDVEFIVTGQQIALVEKTLRKQLDATDVKVKMGRLSYIDGAVELQLVNKEGVLIESVVNPGKPSLYGKNIACFAIELSPEGATLFEEALKGDGGVVQVVYKLSSWARLPGVTVNISYDQAKAYDYYQKIDQTSGADIWREGKYTEKLTEKLEISGAGSITYDWGAIDDEDVKEKIRDWAQRSLETAVKKELNVEEVSATDQGGKATGGSKKTSERTIDIKKSSSFKQTYTENMAIQWAINPQGTLPNITSLQDKDGNLIIPEESIDSYFQTVDLDDPFFKQLNVAVQINADFERLPLYNVEVQLEYANESKTFNFNNADATEKYITYRKDDKRDYTYSYKVNYKGKSEFFKSKSMVDNSQILTIGVDDVGMLLVDVAVGNIDFDKIPKAQVSFRYEDQDNGISLIERKFILDKDNTGYSIQEVLFAPRAKPYQYRIDYFMQDGKQYMVDWQDSQSDRLYIDSPFQSIKTVQVRGVGLQEIESIYLDIRYSEAANGYVRKNSIAISENMPFFDWDVQQIDPRAGKVSYSGTIVSKDGTTKKIATTEAASPTILVGHIIAEKLKISVYPDLFDDESWNRIRLLKVLLKYEDSANNHSESHTIVLRKGATDSQSWELELKDPSARSFQWQAEFFMADGSRKQSEWKNTTDSEIFPDPMAILQAQV